MDNQEAFTRIVTHLRKQGGKSLNANGACRYRDSVTQRRCAIGVLITDEFYTEAIEEKTCIDPAMSEFLKIALPGISLGLLSACQVVHDIWPVCLWEKQWTEVASYYGLVVPGVEDVKAHVASVRYKEEVYAL